MKKLGLSLPAKFHLDFANLRANGPWVLFIVTMCALFLGSLFWFFNRPVQDDPNDKLPYGYTTIPLEGGNELVTRQWIITFALETDDLIGLTMVKGFPLEIAEKPVSITEGYVLPLSTVSNCAGAQELLLLVTSHETFQSPLVVPIMPTGGLLYESSGLLATDQGDRDYYWELIHIHIPATHRNPTGVVQLTSVQPGSVLWAVTVLHDCPPQDLAGYQSLSPVSNGAADMLPALTTAAGVPEGYLNQWRVFNGIPFQLTSYDLGLGSVSIPAGYDVYVLVGSLVGDVSPQLASYPSEVVPISIYGDVQLSILHYVSTYDSVTYSIAGQRVQIYGITLRPAVLVTPQE